MKIIRKTTHMTRSFTHGHHIVLFIVNFLSNIVLILSIEPVTVTISEEYGQIISSITINRVKLI